MSRVPTRTCCCCVPSRAGVVLFALLSTLIGGSITAAAILRIKSAAESRLSLIIEAVVYGVLGLVSILGLIGAIGRKLGLIKFYLGILIVHLLFSIGTGAYATYRIFHDAPGYISRCISSHEGPDAAKLCHDGASITEAIVIGFFVVLWLIEIWGCIIVNSYSRQLREETAAERVMKDTEAW
ncbi:hypothetical protein AX15_004670 [Amanita polypyramis BW_CC]|nr:hypothetical protein AX15_004670 [Amanita polypyramis BW_CC]